MNAHAFLQQKPGAIAAGDRGHLRRQSLSLHGLSPDPARRADPGPRLRCRPGPDAEMPDRSFVPDPGPEASWPGSTWTVLPPPGQPPRALHFTGSGREWYRPSTLAEVHRLKKQFVGQAGREQVKLVFGNTASGVYQQEKPALPDRHLRHRGAGTDRRTGRGHPRRRRGPDPATDRFRDRGDRPAACRTDDRAASLDTARQLDRRLSGALRGQRRRQYLHDPGPCPPRHAVPLRPVHHPGHARHHDHHRLAGLRGRQTSVPA